MVPEVILKVGRMTTALDVKVDGRATQSFNTSGKTRGLGSLSLEMLFVVKHKELTVLGPVRIYFNHVRTSLNGGAESGDSVLGIV